MQDDLALVRAALSLCLISQRKPAVRRCGSARVAANQAVLLTG